MEDGGSISDGGNHFPFSIKPRADFGPSDPPSYQTAPDSHTTQKIMQPECRDNNSPRSSANIKYMWIYTSNLPSFPMIFMLNKSSGTCLYTVGHKDLPHFEEVSKMKETI